MASAAFSWICESDSDVVTGTLDVVVLVVVGSADAVAAVAVAATKEPPTMAREATRAAPAGPYRRLPIGLWLYIGSSWVGAALTPLSVLNFCDRPLWHL